jgi:hypothetical protein
LLNNVLQESLQVLLVTVLQVKAIQIQEATLLVKQLVAVQNKQIFYFINNNKDLLL